MKKILCLILCLFASLSFFGCKNDSNKDDKNLNVINGTTTEWQQVAGGKKYQSTKNDETVELYTDSTLEQTNSGMQFSGTGGYWSKADGTSGAGCGGIYNVAIDASHGFSIDFSIDEIGAYDSTHVNKGNIDCWFGYQISDKPKMFTEKSDIQGAAKGLVGLIIPFSKTSDGHDGAVISYDCGSNWIIRGDSPVVGDIETDHTLEMKVVTDDWGTDYILYLDGVEVLNATLSDVRFNQLFPDGKVYFGFYMESWNAKPSKNDLPEDKEYKSNKFTIKSIEYNGNIIKFGKR